MERPTTVGHADKLSRPSAPAAADSGALEIVGPLAARDRELLTPEVLALIERLERRFGPRIDELLEDRAEVQRRLDAGERPYFPSESACIREGNWRVAPIPADLQDRRVEITGPVERKMVINALNSGANCFMADFEDATTPTWRNLLDGQANLIDAVRGTIEYADEARGKTYRLNERTATLIVRPRGLHLREKHVLLDGRPIHGALFDAALYLAHNAHDLLAKGSGPYLYLAKLEHYREARLWNDVLLAMQDALGLPRGTVRVTVLIETITAAFQMDSILWELREHVTGLNCGRWDYVFSFIKRFRAHESFVLPDRDAVGMDRHFLRSYSRLLIRTCHRRGAFAMGGMAAQVPQRNDPAATAEAIARVRADKRREVNDGHDGTWVAHPALVAVAREEFDAVMTGPNQLGVEGGGPAIGRHDLLSVPTGKATERGLRAIVDVTLRYLESWLRGQGCVAIHGLMEDAATAEIARAQIWQWLRHGRRLDDGRLVDAELVEGVLTEQLTALRLEFGDERFERGRYLLAAQLLRELVFADEFPEFLTTAAYQYV
ncbi:malate synthase A [Engelhardtia mirabilis]|uniref:Malate synthase n=1 Tax=Engelhardtia mirabilis TaxID=2528011 RepID=A0A518BQC0_9BACT|nr:Malate synthase A [Planctomycetes bacterium Pla133]QDV03501.1 Malate synthase A [Planctomycetes bacterium Pla86]